jgi:hypothetical protein
MPRTVVFLSYRAEIPWAARLAGRLKEHGVASHLWIFGSAEHELGVSTSAFEQVTDLMAGFDRQRVTGAAATAARAAARAIETSLGEPFLHREASIDRRLTGFDHIEIPRADIPSRWTWDQICALAVHVHDLVSGLLADLAPEAVMVEPVLLPERLICRVVSRARVPLLIPGFLPYLPDRLYFTDRLDAQWPACTERYLGEEAPSPEAMRSAEETVASVRERATMPQRREDVRDFLPTNRLRFGPSRVTNVWHDWSRARQAALAGDPHSPYPELVTPWARARRKVERAWLRRGFDRWSSPALPSGRFAAYFLHSQPEITVEGWAYEFQDQVALVRNIASTLPADMVLVVKEHRIQAGLRDPAFYAELLSIPGVALVHDGVPTRDVIRAAALVCTLTGTVALEAMALGIPSVVFGDIYYEHFRGIRRVRSFDELRAFVADLGQFKPASDADVLRAFAARYDASRPAGWMSGGRFEADEVQTAAAILLEIEDQRVATRATSA